jgi:hypothetical protein
MAIGAITVVSKSQVPGPLNVDQIAFAGDGAYPSAGTPGFLALVRAALGKGNITILNVVAQECGGYQIVYDGVADKLKVLYIDNNNAADGPMIENATANLSGVTFNLLILSK